MDDIGSMILNEAMECLVECAIEYVFDQATGVNDDRRDESEYLNPAFETEPTTYIPSWEEFIGLNAPHK